MRTSSQFAAYNFREYFRRRTRDAFREHRAVAAESEEGQRLMEKARKELAVLQVCPPLQPITDEVSLVVPAC